MLPRLLSGSHRRRALSLWPLIMPRFLHAGTGAVAPPVDPMPRHVALVMDGNRRWAQARGLTTAEGHEAGGRALQRTVRLSLAWGIRALTAFAFSNENFGRPKMEVDFVMWLIERMIRDHIDEYAREGVRLHVIGDSSRRPASLQKAAMEAEELTRHNWRLHMMLAVCYSGRWDIVQACRELAREAQGGLLRPEDIGESMLAGRLVTSVAVGGVVVP
ncbi:hypothetical protein ACP70R_023154 [Stipagrostis hirtigluma subsp. patula]